LYVTIDRRTQIQVYVREDGSSPFQDWVRGLDPAALLRVSTAQARLGLGKTSNVKWFDGIGEFKINWGPGYRIYLAQDGKALIILFAGGTKKTQQSDIAEALALYQEYQQRKQQAQREEVTKAPEATTRSNRKKRKKGK
jgi:putative addiction module killer protein